MSYRLIDSNAIAIKYPEVNEMPCVFANLPDGMNGQFIDAQPEPQEGHWIWVVGDLECSKCHTRYPDLYPDYDNSVACPHCGARMKGEQNETD